MGSDLKSKDPCGEEMLQVGRVQCRHRVLEGSVACIS